MYALQTSAPQGPRRHHRVENEVLIAATIPLRANIIARAVRAFRVREVLRRAVHRQAPGRESHEAVLAMSGPVQVVVHAVDRLGCINEIYYYEKHKKLYETLDIYNVCTFAIDGRLAEYV